MRRSTGSGNTFTNAGVLTKSAGARITQFFQVGFNNSGAVQVITGSLRFDGGYTQVLTGTLHVGIGGIIPVTGFDQFIVTGLATLGGTLNLALVGDYEPDLGDTFEIMTFTVTSVARLLW